MSNLLSLVNNFCIIAASFFKEIFEKGGLFNMTTSDLIWRLIEILLKDKEKKSSANDLKKD